MKKRNKRSLIPAQVRGLQNRIIDRTNNKEYRHSPSETLSVEEYLERKRKEVTEVLINTSEDIN